MIILAIRTDNPEAELYILKGEKILAEKKWQAHLKLAETLNSNIDEILNKLSISYTDLNGIAVFKGPGSFTGLRIGISVANALAYSTDIPVVARGGDGWLKESTDDLLAGRSDPTAVPEYGSPARTTSPKK